MAIDVIAAVGRSGDADVVGINWGSRAEEAARLGVRAPAAWNAPDEFTGNCNCAARLAAVHVERQDVGLAVAESLPAPTLSRQLNGAAYVRNNHAASVLLPELEAGYAKVLGATE